MNQQEFLQLLQKYREGRATQEEINFIHAYYDLFDQGEDGLGHMEPGAKALLQRRIKSGIDSAILQQASRPARNLVWMRRLSVAAVVLLLLGTGAFLLLQPEKTAVQTIATKTAPATDIAPGSNKAILVLADGSSLSLDDAQKGDLSRQGNALVRKTDDGQLVYLAAGESAYNATLAFNTISTPRAGQYQLTLSDGTRVWLNAATTLKFPAEFTGTERIVELNGEAYFEVAANPQKPFLVRSTQQTIRVLGTHFNVNTYEDESAIRTTLLEGKVEVQAAETGAGEPLVLAPGQQSALSRNGRMSITVADTEEVIAWKNGFFKFNKADIQTIMRQVARWYDVEVQFEGKIPDDLFVGKINRSENISGVLRILELSKVPFTIENKTVIIGKK